MGWRNQWQGITAALERRHRDLRSGFDDSEIAALRAEGGGLPEVVGLDPNSHVTEMSGSEAQTIHRIGSVLARLTHLGRPQ